MILTVTEYAAAQDQLTRLESWLERLKRDQPLPDKGLIRSSIRRPRTVIDESFGRLTPTPSAWARTPMASRLRGLGTSTS